MLTGIVIGVLLSLVGILLYDKFKKPNVKDDMTEEEKEREEREKSHYDSMMNFSAEKAYSGGKG